MFKPSAFHIIDPGLMETGGHYFTQDASIAKECRKRDIPVSIYCRNGANLSIDDIKIFEIFRFDVYFEPMPENPTYAVFENFFLINRAFFLDLNAIQCNNFTPDDIVYFPGLTQNQLEGVADWIIGLPIDRRPNIVITLRVMNSRMHYNANRGYTSTIEFLYRFVLSKLIERHPRTFLLSDTDTISLFYNRISGLPVTLAPIPQLAYEDDYEPRPVATDNTLSVLYIGNVSPYRGCNFIAGIVDAILDEFSNVRFTVQVKANHDSDSARMMVAISDAHTERVQFLFGQLTPDEYVKTMQSADIVLLPYMPSYYYFGSSGVFAEAAAMGKVIVITKGTTMETTAYKFDLGSIFAEEYTQESFVSALKAAIKDFDALDQKARNSYMRFARENSPEGFLDHLLNLIV